MKRILKFSILLLVVFACKRETVDYLGPAFIAAPTDFSVTSFTATLPAVNFVTSTETFNATFTHTVSWILTVTGQESGAVYEVTGISNGFSNVWKGTNTGMSFFRTGEKVTATISFFGTKYTSSIEVDITKARNYASYGQFPRGGDFEDPLIVEPQPPLYSPYWASFNFPTPIPNVDQGVDSVAIDYHGNIVPSIQGEKYYFIKGLGAQSNFVSGLQYFGPLNPKLPATPDNVWINMYIYGTGDANAGVEIEYQEDDIRTAPGYNGKIDDAFVTYITLSHKGWKLFSVKYSDLTPSKNADFGGSGNRIHEPKRLISFDVIAIKKTNPDKPVEIYFDFPIITVGGPFDPSK